MSPAESDLAVSHARPVPSHPHPPSRSPAWWRRLLPYVGSGLALLLFAGALVLLHRQVAAYRPEDVRRALGALTPWQVPAALALAAASYWLLTLYDVLALRHLGRALPYGRVALAAFASYAISHSLGFGSVVHASIRYRLYGPLGLTPARVAEVTAFVHVTFVIGLALIFPAVALLDAAALDALGLPRRTGLGIAAGALLIAAGYVSLGHWRQRPIALFGRFALTIPRPGTALAQIALSAADLALAAAVLYACRRTPASPGTRTSWRCSCWRSRPASSAMCRAGSASSTPWSRSASRTGCPGTRSSPGCWCSASSTTSCR